MRNTEMLALERTLYDFAFLSYPDTQTGKNHGRN